MATGASFIADMQKWAGGNREKLTLLARQSILELAYRTQQNTTPPVGPNVVTGFLVNSWQPGINAIPPPQKQGETPSVFLGKDTDAELAVTVSTMKPGDVFYYVNNAEYAMRQNYGFTGTDALGRHYNQQGKFFVQKTLAQWSAIVANAAAGLRFRPV